MQIGGDTPGSQIVGRVPTGVRSKEVPGAQRPERARSIGPSECPDIVVPEHLLQRASSACLGTDEEVDDDDERPAQRHTEALLLAFGDTNRNCNE